MTETQSVTLTEPIEQVVNRNREQTKRATANALIAWLYSPRQLPKGPPCGVDAQFDAYLSQSGIKRS